MFEWPVVLLGILLLYLLSSIKILAEYERGVIFRLGRILAQPKGPGLILVFAPIDRMVRNLPADRGHGSSSTGCGDARQRHSQSQRGDLFPGGGADPAPWWR